MLKIGDFSKIAGVTPRMLKYYEESRLLLPHHIDKCNGYRYYEMGQLMELAQIKMLQSVGFSFKEMRGLIGKDISSKELNSKKQQNLQFIQDALDRIQLIEFYEKSTSNLPFNQKYTAVIREISDRKVVSARRRLSDISKVESFIFAILEEAEEKGYAPLSPVYGTATFYDEEYREENMDCEVTFSVKQQGKKSSVFTFKELDAELAVCVLHKGAYKFLRGAYIFAYDWINKNSYEPSGLAREKYLSGTWDNAVPECDYLTELQIPVKKKQK